MKIVTFFYEWSFSCGRRSKFTMEFTVATGLFCPCTAWVLSKYVNMPKTHKKKTNCRVQAKMYLITFRP